jgi:prolyl 4-hydroxylase
VTDLSHSEDQFAPSTVSTGAETSIQKDIRFSEVALIDRDDVVRCVEHRARDFQGWRPDIHIERLRTQRYGIGGHYKHHFDWSGGNREADRVSTFMVYVDADCEGGGKSRLFLPATFRGQWTRRLKPSHLTMIHRISMISKNCSLIVFFSGTEFPRIRMPNVERGRWCEFIGCGKSSPDGEYSEETGVTFKPIKGNAVFWENLGPDGRGYEQTFHAGLPVTSGTKIGLNIWSWGPARRR